MTENIDLNVGLPDPDDHCEFDQVETKLDLAYEDLGEQQVKNIARPVRAYRVRRECAAPPARRGASPVRMLGAGDLKSSEIPLVLPPDGQVGSDRRQPLKLDPRIDWLPAIVVRGEGLFLEFDSGAFDRHCLFFYYWHFGYCRSCRVQVDG